MRYPTSQPRDLSGVRYPSGEVRYLMRLRSEISQEREISHPHLRYLTGRDPPVLTFKRNFGYSIR